MKHCEAIGSLYSGIILADRNAMPIKLISIFLITFAVTAQAWIIQSGDSKQWLAKQKAVPSVYEEMNKYFLETDPKSHAMPYVKSFIPFMHTQIVNEAEISLTKKLNKLTCSAETNISYPGILTKEFDFQSKRDFEKEILKIQSYDCLGKLNLDKVFATLMSEKFQKEAVDGLKQIKTNQQTNQVCQVVSIFPFGTTNFCFTQNVLATGKQYLIHSYNEQNIQNPSAPAYYREAITVISQLPTGEISIYNLAYARGPDLPFHSVVKSMIATKQELFIQKLIENSK